MHCYKARQVGIRQTLAKTRLLAVPFCGSLRLRSGRAIEVMPLKRNKVGVPLAVGLSKWKGSRNFWNILSELAPLRGIAS